MSSRPRNKSPKTLVSTVPKIRKPSPHSTATSPSPGRKPSPRGRSPLCHNGGRLSPPSFSLGCQQESYESYAQTTKHLKEIADKLKDRMVNNVIKISKLEGNLNNALEVSKQWRN